MVIAGKLFGERTMNGLNLIFFAIETSPKVCFSYQFIVCGWKTTGSSSEITFCKLVEVESYSGLSEMSALTKINLKKQTVNHLSHISNNFSEKALYHNFAEKSLLSCLTSHAQPKSVQRISKTIRSVWCQRQMYVFTNRMEVVNISSILH